MSRWAVVFLSLLGFSCAGPSLRDPAAAKSGPPMSLRLVCAGPATDEFVFSFSGNPKELMAHFREDGSANVSGVAQVTIRARGDHSEYDGPVHVGGTRSPDGRLYFLEAFLHGQRLQFSLVRDGTATLERTQMTGLRKEQKVVYRSICQDVY